MPPPVGLVPGRCIATGSPIKNLPRAVLSPSPKCASGGFHSTGANYFLQQRYRSRNVPKSELFRQVPQFGTDLLVCAETVNGHGLFQVIIHSKWRAVQRTGGT